jgi:hypothetical protein
VKIIKVLLLLEFFLFLRALEVLLIGDDGRAYLEVGRLSATLTERRRGPRSDIGAVRMQPRDAAALAWIGEQFGAPLDVLSVLLARLGKEPLDRLTVSTVRTHVRRWESAGWVTSHRLPGGVWVTPTRRALEMVARPDYHALEPWVPQVPRLPHVRAVALVRLAFEATNPPEPQDPWGRPPSGPRWVSERLLEQDIRMKRWGTTTTRRPDALIRFPDGQDLAIEVELTVKAPSRYREIVHHTSRRVAQVRWMTWPEHRERLLILLMQAKEEDRHPTEIFVDELPAVRGTYPEPWELPYEAWRPER